MCITGDFTGSSTSAFPYSLSAKNDQTIFSSECIPDGLRLSDPDHLTTLQINRLYTHWLKRQDEGLAPLIILNASPLHGASIKKSEKSKGKAKAKVGWVEVGDDEEEEEEEELLNEQKEGGDEEEGEDDDEERNDDTNAGTPAVIKYGPPQGKKKQNPSSAQRTANSAVAGPSTAPPPKRVSKASKAGKPPKPLPTFQSQAPSITDNASNLPTASRPSKTKNSVASTGPVAGQV